MTWSWELFRQWHVEEMLAQMAVSSINPPTYRKSASQRILARAAGMPKAWHIEEKSCERGENTAFNNGHLEGVVNWQLPGAHAHPTSHTTH
jgi:hypothetical protein